MGTLEEVNQMKAQGLSQEQIIKTLRDRKIPYKEISDALSQTEIKAAVEQPATDPSEQTPPAPTPTPDLQAPSPTPTPTAEMQPSIASNQATPDIAPPQFSDDSGSSLPPIQDPQMQTSPQINQQAPPAPDIQAPPNTFPIPEPAPAPTMAAPPAPTQAPQTPAPAPEIQAPTPSEAMPPQMPEDQGTYQDYQDYPEYQEGGYEEAGYQDYSGGVSSDTITEVAEQVVAQKFSDIRKPLEKVIEFKTTVETKIDSVEERLARIEKTIHTLQSSVLGKVGEYMTNIDDIKKELVETQKSFTKVASSAKKTTRKKATKKK